MIKDLFRGVLITGVVSLLVALCSMQAFSAMIGSTSCASGGELAVDTQVCTGTTCRLCSVEVITDGTNNATCTVYDGTSASGVKITKGGPVVGAALWGGVTYEVPIRASKGLYLDVTGTGAKCIVTYDK